MDHNSQTLSSAADEAAILRLYKHMMEGWNAASGDAFAAPFEENGDLVGFDGTHLSGIIEIASFHQYLFDMFLKGSRLVGKVRSVRFLTTDVAVCTLLVERLCPVKPTLTQNEIRFRRLLL
jgi:uncharacterized protein (TIGR02246 family)